MTQGNYIKDSEGNQFFIKSITGEAVTLKGEAGEKEICVSDLKFYKLIK